MRPKHAMVRGLVLLAASILLRAVAAADPAPPRDVRPASGPVMALIPAGEFRMGDARGGPDARPVRTVRVSAFYMDITEVTQASFQALTGLNTAKVRGDQNPVEQTTWLHAARYCNARSEKEGLKPCYNPDTWVCDVEADGYRLPTEAEWEYACRAGAATAYSFGDDPQKLAAYAWVKANAEGTPHPVGRKLPNAWGLFDMHGNVMEWCNDWYAVDAYAGGAAADPRGPVTGEFRVLRGGGWRSPPKAATCAGRAKDAPTSLDTCLGYPDYGFRCVRRVVP